MVVVDCVVTVCCVVGHTTQAGECAAVPANKRRGYAAQLVHCHFAGTRDRVTQILRCCIDFSFPVFLTAVVSLIVSALCVELLDYVKREREREREREDPRYAGSHVGRAVRQAC